MNPFSELRARLSRTRRMPDPREALGELKEHPKRFLRRYLVSVTGLAAALPSGPYPYYLGFMPGAGERYTICPDPQLLDPGYASFMAYAVAMVSYNDVANPGALDGYEVLNGGGPEIMVTGQLTGCTFAMLETVRGVLMTHLRPGVGTTGAQLRDALAAGGAFAAHDGQPIVSFGAGQGPRLYDSGAERVTVIGVRRSWRWTVYAQIQQAMPAAVARVVQIYPPRG